MTAQIDPRFVYPESSLFLDYVAGRDAALRLFPRASGAFPEAATVGSVSRPREELSDALLAYNERLGASVESTRNVNSLRDPSTLCVLGGQQAGFLGGPSYTAYKILSIVRSAARLESVLGVRVIPVFWLASEDHDVTEINRVLLLDDDGSIRRIAFAWSDAKRAIESLPITDGMRAAADEVLARFPSAAAETRDLFRPQPGDDYAGWHARIWSRLFAKAGLVLVEPRTVRHLAGRLFETALSKADRVTAALHRGADAVAAAGYERPLDPDRAGRPFRLDAEGRRMRVDDPAAVAATPRRSPGTFSTDAALRPVFADAIFPTIANVLGPSELAYHAMLPPLYDLFEIPQPIPVPRHGYTLLASEDEDLLLRLGVTITEVISSDFDPKATLRHASSVSLRDAFAVARRGAEAALEPLRDVLRELDPGLEARWRQASDHAGGAIDRLEEGARRADLARRGLSARELHVLRASLLPAGKPQERGLSFIHFAIRFGVEWLDDLPGSELPDRFSHYAVTLRGGE